MLTLIMFIFTLSLLEVQGHFECDSIHEEIPDNNRLFTYNLNGPWPQGAVTYSISKLFTDDQQELIRQSMEYIESLSCVRFIRKSKDEALLLVRTVDRTCFADIGYIDSTHKRYLRLSPKICMKKKIIAHELLHSLGFIHEQCRPDRDIYIRVHWKNILSDKRKNFYKTKDITSNVQSPYCKSNTPIEELDSCVSGFLTKRDESEYDYNSIMHYGSKYFGVNKSITLSAIDQSIKIGPGTEMSPLDVKRLNRRYPCNNPLWNCRDELDNCIENKEVMCKKKELAKKCKRTCRKCKVL